MKTSNTSAHVVLKNAEVVAIVKYQYSRAGVVHCEVISGEYGPTIHRGKAAGYGYDKTTASIAGAVIDGVTIYDHCSLPTEKDKQIMEGLVEIYKRHGYQVADDAAAKHGARMANSGDNAYYISGIDRLTAMGYKIVKAI